MSLGNVINEIMNLEHFKVFDCSKCGGKIRHHALQIYADCPSCHEHYKTRGMGGVGTEIEDLIDAVLERAGEGERLDMILRRQREICLAAATDREFG